jgi:hydroxypyruvate isomerase
MKKHSRRSAIKKLVGAAALIPAAGTLTTSSSWAHSLPQAEGGINQSVCKWCYSEMSVEELAKEASKMGYQSIEILHPEDWKVLSKYDLICAMSNGPGGIEEGWNKVSNHEWLVPGFIERIKDAANAGYPQVIAFSGNRNGMDDEKGLENSVKGLQQIMKTAEQYNVTISMELLNSKVNHPDYMCDHTPWGVELVKQVGSDRFKLLYDIYHMQIMEGDVIRTIQDNHQYISHYHTGGNPGRHEIDDTQELNYPAIIKAIRATGYTGFLGQEFVPARDPMTSLAQAYGICDV